VGGYPEITEGLEEALAPALDTYGIRAGNLAITDLELVADPEDLRRMELASTYGGKVVIFGTDGFDWDIYREVSKKRRMPHIERLIEEGATGDLMSMEPLVSPMIWTTMATGVEPDVHGIVDFLMKDPATGEDVPITSTMRRVPALWNIATRFGMSSCFVGWLGTYPAEQIKGFMVSDRLVFHTFDPRWREGNGEHRADMSIEGLVHPEPFMEEVKGYILEWEDIDRDVLEAYIEVPPEDLEGGGDTFDPLDPVRNLRLILAANTTYEHIAAHCHRTYHPVLTSVYLDLVDNVCHLFIKHMEPHTEDVSDREARRYGEAVAAAYAHTDSVLGVWLDMIDDRTTLVMVSDHGFKSGDIRPEGPSLIGGGQAVNWHRIAGSIALYGNRVKKGARLRSASVLDVAPTVLRLLGLPVAADMPGAVLEEALEPGWLASSGNIEPVETYGLRSDVGSAVRRAEEEEAILERLKALGYVGGGSTGLDKLAHSHFTRGDYQKAVEIWNKVLAKDPENLEAMTSLANVLLHQGDLEEAMKVLRSAKEKNPDFLPARNLMAMCYINLGRTDQARRISQEVLAMDPDNAEAHFNLGVVSEMSGDYERALAGFKRSVELRGDYDESRINLANEYLRRGNVERGLHHLSRALEINPSNHHAWYLKGKAHQAARDPDQAAESFRQALSVNPAYNQARLSLAVVLFKEGRMEEARRVLTGGLEHPEERAAIRTNLGVLEREIGDLDAAEKHFERAIQVDPGFLPPRFALVDLYLARGDRADARRQVDEILEIEPGNSRALRLVEQIR
jgi:tetratricopeptide (TPR) repeat protein